MAATKRKKKKAPAGPAHAELGASSASRWMACAGSPRLCRDLPERRSIWAAEGTAAHEVGEMCLKRDVNASVYGGQKVPVDGFDEPFIVDTDMIDAVQVYLDHIRGIIGERGSDKDVEWIEERVSLSAFADGADDILHKMFGTADYIRYLVKEHTLVVVDYKHGAGVKVSAEDNDQGRYYALGALAKVQGMRVDKVEIHIVQPRADEDEPVSVDVVDVVDLLDWSVDLFDAARATLEPDAPVVAGSHCRFCKAQGVCPAVRADRMDQAKLVFNGAKIEPEKPLDKLSLDELRQILDSAEDISAWINKAQKLAHDMLEAGQDVPGYKIVAKRAQRKWRNERRTADWLCTEFGLGDEDIYGEPKIKSPAQIEKLLDKDGKKALKGADLVTAESSGNTLAPETDKRPPVEGRPAPDKVFAPVD